MITHRASRVTSKTACLLYGMRGLELFLSNPAREPYLPFPLSFPFYREVP